MIIIALFRWWYGEGLLKQAHQGRQRIAATADYFSIGILIRTLFSPFRQISVGGVRGPLGVQLRAWLDRLVSRFVGAGVRSFTIIAGIVGLAVSCLFAFLRLAGWVLLPVAPLVGLVLSATGWVPWEK